MTTVLVLLWLAPVVVKLALLWLVSALVLGAMAYTPREEPLRRRRPGGVTVGPRGLRLPRNVERATYHPWNDRRDDDITLELRRPGRWAL